MCSNPISKDENSEKQKDMWANKCANITTTDDKNCLKTRKSVKAYLEGLNENKTNILAPLHSVRCGGSWQLTKADNSKPSILKETILSASSCNEYIEPEEIVKHETDEVSEFEILSPTFYKRSDEDVWKPQISIVETEEEKRASIKARIPILDWKPEMEKLADIYMDFKKANNEQPDSDEVDELLLQISLFGCEDQDELMSVLDEYWSKSPTKEAWTEIFSDMFPLIRSGAIPEFHTILDILLFAYQELKAQENSTKRDELHKLLITKTGELEHQGNHRPDENELIEQFADQDEGDLFARVKKSV